MTPHRSDLDAAHARIAALERELAAAHDPRERARPPPPAPIPRGYEVSETTDRLRITWTVPGEPWPRAARGVLAVVLPVAITVGIRHDHLLLLCIAGIVAGLALLTGVSERAVLELSGGRLRIDGGAAPRGYRPLPAGDVDQLYSVMRHGEGRASYELWSLLVGGERVCLVRAIDGGERALFLKRELERRLCLPVLADGELPRPA